MTYLWRIPDRYPNSLIGEYVTAVSPDRFLFLEGRAINEEIGTPAVQFSARLANLSKFACLPNSGMIPLISAEFGELLLSEAAADIQLIKTKVHARDGDSENFFILNLKFKVVGIDRDQSTFVYIPGTREIMAFNSLKYVEGCLGHHMLARDANYLSHLLVSAKLVEMVKKRGFLGVDFLRAEEIDW